MNQGFKLKPHKGYIGSVIAEVELGYYWGTVLDVQVPVEYEADSLDNLQEEFESAVDEYLRIVNLE